MKKLLAGSLLALATVSSATAQTPAQVTWIHAGRLIDRPGEAPRGPSTIIVREGKAVGYDAKIMRKVVALRKMKPDDRAEMEAILDLYKAALGLG